MIKTLQDFFKSKSNSLRVDTVPSDHELKLAAASLMFETVRADGHVDELELQRMSDALREQFSLSDDDVATMIELARHSTDQAISLQGFTREICDNWDNERRVKLLEQMWVIALSDDVLDAHERHLVRKVAGLLYLNDAQIIRARENAKAVLAANNA